MFFRIAVQQTRHQWAITLLILLAMTALVTLYVYSNNTSEFANRSIQLVMKNMGHNLLIIPESTDPWSIYVGSKSQPTFPDTTTREMSSSLGLSSRYYVSVLQQEVEIDGTELLLTGIEPVARKDESAEKRNMILPLQPNEVRLGHESAAKLDRRVGQTLQIRGKEFQIVEILPSKATLDDCRVYISLSQCQDLLGKEGQINYILAFLCHHGGTLDDALRRQEEKLAATFPEFRQISRLDIAQGRHLARVTTRKSLNYLIAIVAVATMIIIAVTGLQEVNDRRQETGILIAMGMSQTSIVSLYLLKILVLALLASFVGFLLGSGLAVHFTQPFLVVNTRPVTILWQQLPGVVGLTCGIVVVAELLPIMKLVSSDPNTILSQQ